jgi:hypothetical protein
MRLRERYNVALDRKTPEQKAKSILGDIRYAQRYRFRGWNIMPTVLLEPRLFPRAFPELTKSQHLQIANQFARRAETIALQWRKWIKRGEATYGTHGPVVSGGFHDDWPESVKETIRRLAHGTSLLEQASQAHLKASKLRNVASHSPRRH